MPMFARAGVVNEAIEQILTPIQTAGINAVIAGGFLRDAILDRDYRDVDLYVHYDNVHKVAKLLGLDFDTEEVDYFSEGDAAYDHQSIAFQKEYHCSALGSCIVNLIGLKGSYDDVHPRTIVGRFNLGICMVGINAYEAHISEAFQLDMVDHQITLFRSEWGLEGSMKQWIKLQAKYPWPLRIAA